MHLDALLKTFGNRPAREALIDGDSRCTYGELIDRIERCLRRLDAAGIAKDAVVALRGDSSVQAVALLLALLHRGSIVLPLAGTNESRIEKCLNIGAAEWLIGEFEDEAREPSMAATGRRADHALYDQLRSRGHPGLVLFSSGSTGEIKGIVHDAVALLSKFRKPGRDLRTLVFLLFDHIGGIDTLFYGLSNGSTLALTRARDPDSIAALIARERIEVLPATPSFLNLLLLSGAHERHDLSSLRIITYGAEMMPASTLGRCAAALPHVQFLQRYGATETGALKGQSVGNDSLFIRLRGEGVEWRVRDGRLELRAPTTMLGYLNAPSPFTEDGWFMTGDCVEVEGDSLRILGRDSDMINVGGRKVFPAEVENAIREIANIADVSVYAAPNAVLSQIVACRVRLIAPEDAGSLRRRLKSDLARRLEDYKIPARIEITSELLTNDRMKQVRR